MLGLGLELVLGLGLVLAAGRFMWSLIWRPPKGNAASREKKRIMSLIAAGRVLNNEMNMRPP